MNARILIVVCIGLVPLVACDAPATAGPVEPLSNAGGAQAQPTEPEALAPSEPAPSATMEVAMPFELTSTAFAQGAPIPEVYSCKGEDISPPLAWGDPPDGTRSFALVMDDPDAPVGTWDHWIIFNLPADLRALPENLQPGDLAANHGANSWGRADYGGPCPPSGTHRYFFKLYALDTTLSMDEIPDKGQLLADMEGHILAETELMGTFSH